MNSTKKILLPLLAVLTLGSCGKSVNTSKTLKTPLDSFSYMLGLRTAFSYKGEGLKEIDYSSFAKGFEDGIKKDSGYDVSEKRANAAFQGYLQKLRADGEKKAKEATTAWLADNKKKSGMEELPSKAQFKMTSRGNGPVPTLNDTVIIHFKVKDKSGKLIQNTEDMKKPLTIAVKFIPIEGLREWITRVPAGSKATLYIPGPLPGFQGGSLEEEFSVYIWEMNLLGMNPGPTVLEGNQGEKLTPEPEVDIDR
jgi:FKBP-type peptidyl-prolyl cis-trans isomerase